MRIPLLAYADGLRADVTFVILVFILALAERLSAVVAEVVAICIRAYYLRLVSTVLVKAGDDIPDYVARGENHSAAYE